MRPSAILNTFVLAEGIAGYVMTNSRRHFGQGGNRIQNPGTSRPAAPSGCRAIGKAVYLLTNDDDNSVIALPINADGTLRKGTATSTGGKGATGVNAKGEPATPDALISQGSLTIAGQHIFAVNAGSNTVSMLAISPDDPTRLTMVGRPAAVPGEFPNTVAASARKRLACVATTGAVAGISCAPFTAEDGLGAMDGLRPIDLGQSTPPVGPTNTVSHAFFSEDESTLFTTVKGDPAANKTGFLSVLAVGEQQNGCGGSATAAAAAARDSRVSPGGTAVLFGSQVIPGTGNIFATDASFGAAVLSVDAAKGDAAVVGRGAVGGQAATCWSAFSAATGSVFVTDVAVPRIVEMGADDAGVLSQLDLSRTGGPGFVDLGAAGDFLYALSPGNGTTGAAAAVAVVDVSGGRGEAELVQTFSLDGVAASTAQGMAVLA